MSIGNAVRVLIVDDNELTRSLLGLILRGAEYNVVGEAQNAKTALDMAKKVSPDVILLDNNMPNGNGVDIIKPLRAILPKAIILMVTTQGNNEIIQASMERGANGFVIKPFNTESVLATMKQARDKFVLVGPASLRT